MPGDLAAEQRALRAHARLEEGVPDSVDVGGAARARDGVGYRAGGAHVVEDRSPGSYRFASSDSASSAVRKSPSTNWPVSSMKKQRSASPSQAIPRSAPAASTRSMMNWRFSGSSGLGSCSGKFPSGVQQVSIRSSPKPLQQRPGDGAGHPVAAVDDDLQGLDHRRVDELEDRLVELRVEVDLLDRAFAEGLGQTGFDHAADVLDAAVAGQRDRALAHELCAGVGLRVVRGRAHQAAVERRASRRGSRASRCQPGLRRARSRPRPAGRRGIARRARGRSGACRARGRRAARRRACLRDPRARARRHGRSARRSGRRSARRRGRGCRRP